MLIILTDRECAAADAEADRIQDLKEAAGLPSNVHHADTRTVRRAAVRAEYAFQKLFPRATRPAEPTMPDGTPNPRAGDGGWDFQFLPSGITVDVKSTTPGNTLMRVLEKHLYNGCDVYVLAQVNGNKVAGDEVTFVGWVWSQDVDTRTRTTESHAGPAGVVGEDMLLSMSRFMREVG